MIWFGERAAQSFAAKLRAQVEALHFADAGLKFVQGDAACELPFVRCQQKAAFGRSVVAGKAGEFLVEVLKAEAEAEGLRVFEEEFAGLGDLGRRFGLRRTSNALYHRGHRGHRGSFEKLDVRLSFPLWSSVSSVVKVLDYPISMPPFTFSTWPVM